MTPWSGMESLSHLQLDRNSFSSKAYVIYSILIPLCLLPSVSPSKLDP